MEVTTEVRMLEDHLDFCKDLDVRAQHTEQYADHGYCHSLEA